MEPNKNNYRSYLLRLWRVQSEGDPLRASLEDVMTNEVHHFNSLEALVQYLEDNLASPRKIQVVLEGKPD
ncbi:hypothetical protein ACFLZW_07200 [Chloroflexota bacterium]